MLATLCVALGAAGLIPLQRDDLARSFLRFEAAFAAHAPSAADRVATERAFDALSMQFLAGNFADALAQLDTLTARLAEPETATTAQRMAFDALGVRVRGDIVTLGTLYLPDLDEPVELATTLLALDASGKELARKSLTLTVDDLDGVELEVDLELEVPERLDSVRIVDANGRSRDTHPNGEEGRGVRRLVGEEALAKIPGDTHRTFELGDISLAARVFVPQVQDSTKSLPLVIALHGAGGDEHMFFEAYGQGALVRQARERGFVAVAPLTYTVLARPDALLQLIEAIAQIAPIDRNRVYVIGHSLGGITTIELLKRNADQIAAACCIAGGTPTATTATKLPRTLVIVGANDPLMRGDTIEKSAKQAIESGAPITLRIERDRGHTLMVGELMGEVLEWLMKG
ncbi:MAG: alpha/beta fold hydrolase [Planctomycetes bacterium]|nr:alpha/beta fold hydrolase [Planctomycetota bacterium]